MLSLIICSRSKGISNELNNNIQSTIGVEFELIILDNSKNIYSIFSAYNEGVKRAKYSFLCFMHDDILYKTQNWGEIVLNHFQSESVGLLGVLGTHFIPKTPSGWIQPNVKSGQIIQGQSKNGGLEILSHFKEFSRFDKDKTIVNAVAVDGVWMCIRKDLFKCIKFDESLFSGFNCYDLDICFQIIQLNKQVCIISDLEIIHYSYGSFSQSWIDASVLLFNKWKMYLPQVAGVLISEKEQELRSFFVDNIFELIKENNKINSQLLSIRNSVYYKFGRAVLNPISFFKRKLHK